MNKTSSLPEKPPRVVVLYDGGCPLCRREIAHYRRLDRDERVHWLDLTSQEAGDLPAGIDRAEAMALFHVRDRHGRWAVGAYGFVTLWDNLPYYRHLARVVRSLRLSKLLDRVYRRFARWRLARRCSEGCALDSRHG
jgi:predicted DCC family thiol-disulfide oxidoreductase YuxK